MEKIIRIERCYDCKNMVYCDPETVACCVLSKIVNEETIDPDCPLEDYKEKSHE